MAGSSTCPTASTPTSRPDHHRSPPDAQRVHRVRALDQARARAAWKLPLFLAQHPQVAPTCPAAPALMAPPVSFATAATTPCMHSAGWTPTARCATSATSSRPRPASRPCRRWPRASAGPTTCRRRSSRAGGGARAVPLRGHRGRAGRPGRRLEPGLARRPRAPGRRHDRAHRPRHRARDRRRRARLRPTRVVDGIELSDDPLLHFRTRAYSVSVQERTGRTRPEHLA